MDRNNYYGGASASLNLNQVREKREVWDECGSRTSIRAPSCFGPPPLPRRHVPRRSTGLHRLPVVGREPAFLAGSSDDGATASDALRSACSAGRPRLWAASPWDHRRRRRV